jgi:outer membrane protein
MFKLLVSFLMVTMVSSAYAKYTIGLVDIQKVLVSVNDGKKVMKKLEKIFNGKKKVISTEEEKIKKMQADFQKQSMVLSDSSRMEKQRTIQKAILVLQQKTMKFQKEIQEEEKKLKKPIITKIQKIVNQISKNEKVDITFELNTSPIIFAKNKKNLTDKVIKTYNKK